MTNTTEIIWQNKEDAGIVVNGQHIGVYKFTNGYKKDGFTPKRHWMVQLSNIHNQSDRIIFFGATVKSLLKKIEKHQFELVK